MAWKCAGSRCWVRSAGPRIRPKHIWKGLVVDEACHEGLRAFEGLATVAGTARGVYFRASRHTFAGVRGGAPRCLRATDVLARCCPTRAVSVTVLGMSARRRMPARGCRRRQVLPSTPSGQRRKDWSAAVTTRVYAMWPGVMRPLGIVGDWFRAVDLWQSGCGPLVRHQSGHTRPLAWPD